MPVKKANIISLSIRTSNVEELNYLLAKEITLIMKGIKVTLTIE